MQRCTQVTLLSSSAQLLPPQILPHRGVGSGGWGGGGWNFFNRACVSFTYIFGGTIGINMTKRKGKFENVYSEIAWRGQREQRRGKS